MNNKHRVAIIVLGLLCVALVVLLGYRMIASRESETGTPIRPPTEETSKPEPTPTPVSGATSSSVYKDLVEITSPLPDSVIDLTEPETVVMVTGKARGNWFFEASFPIELMNEKGDVLAIGIAQAQGEWMTTDYVPFQASVKFKATIAQTGLIGALVLRKDNPSGEPAYDDAFTVPVRFVP